MHFKTAIASSYKQGLKYSLFVLPIFVPLSLAVIKPYWPANIFGWLAIIAFIVFFEIGYLAFLVYVESRRSEPKDFSFTKIIKALAVAVPFTLATVIFLMRALDYARDHFFIIKL